MNKSSLPTAPRALYDTGRLDAFSDGVFAIVITLLVLELHVPELSGRLNAAEELAAELIALTPKLISFVISFFYISIYWFNHHQLFHNLKKSDRTLFWLNTVFLLFLTFIPFPTALIGSYPEERLAVMIYGAAMLLTAVSFIAIKLYINKDKTREETKAEGKRFIFYLLAGPLLYLLAIMLALVCVKGAIILYILIPFIYLFAQSKQPPHAS